jgi:hypothetical protein
LVYDCRVKLPSRRIDSSIARDNAEERAAQVDRIVARLTAVSRPSSATLLNRDKLMKRSGSTRQREAAPPQSGSV